MVAEASHEMTYVCDVELCCCAVVMLLVFFGLETQHQKRFILVIKGRRTN